MKNKITSMYLQARKDKNETAKGLLSTLIGDIEKIEINTKKEASDAEVTQCVNKLLKGVNEVLKFKPEDKQALEEKEILEQFLPKMLTEAEIEDIIQIETLKGATTVGDIMKVFKDLPVDRKLVSQIYKNLIESSL